jgi:hypothetical protein
VSLVIDHLEGGVGVSHNAPHRELLHELDKLGLVHLAVAACLGRLDELFIEEALQMGQEDAEFLSVNERVCLLVAALFGHFRTVKGAMQFIMDRLCEVVVVWCRSDELGVWGREVRELESHG